jgi:glucose 1-dehydrogenase
VKAVVVRPPAAGAELLDVAAPARGAGLVRVDVRRVGVCGTDRDIVAGKYGKAPEGRPTLVLGHENLGQVAEVDPSEPRFRAGDWVVATVRRGCGRCRYCFVHLSDLCETGAFTERGICGADGYLSESYVEDPSYLVAIPPELGEVAVLLEPMSVVEKSIRVGLAVRSARLPPVEPPARLAALVAGSGAIGMLAAAVLRLRGADVTVVDRHPGATPAAQLLELVGAVHGTLEQRPPVEGPRGADLVIEATGAPELAVDLAARLAPNGVLVLAGIPPSDAPASSFALGGWARRDVLENLSVVGSVNASRADFEAGARDLAEIGRRWPGWLPRLITARRPMSEAVAVLSGRSAGEIKTVLTVP